MSGTTQIFPIGEKPRNGGWRGSPNSLAALDRHRPSFADFPKCRKCRRIAVRGGAYCARHTGENTPLPSGFGRAESRYLRSLEHRGLLPLELIVLPVWRGLIGLPTKDRAPMRLALIQAWDRRELEPLHWSQVQRRALELAAMPGPRRPVQTWYENR